MDFWIGTDGAIYTGDLRSGDRKATESEVAAWDLARAASSLAVYRASVVELLQETDVAAARFFKAGLPFPQEWSGYVVALRDLYHRGDLSAAAPARPCFPVGV